MIQIQETSQTRHFIFEHGGEIIKNLLEGDGGYEWKHSQNKEHFDKDLKKARENDRWVMNDTNWEQLEHDLINGVCTDSERLDRFRAAKQAVDKSRIATTVKRRRKRSEFDGEINMERAMAGQTDFYDVKTKTEKLARGKEIFIDIAVASHMSSSTYVERMLNMFTEIYKEAAKGYMVKVSLIATAMDQMVSGNKKKYQLYSLVIKEANKPVDLHRFANISYMGYYRGAMFATWCKCTDDFGVISGGYGRCLSEASQGAKVLKDVGITQGTYYHMISGEKCNIEDV